MQDKPDLIVKYMTNHLLCFCTYISSNLSLKYDYICLETYIIDNIHIF